MKYRLKLFGLVGLFWICFFEVCRIVFLLYQFDQTAGLTFREIGTVLLLGLRMDLAMTGYWLIITGLLLTAPVRNFKPIYYIQNFFTIFLVVLSVAIVVVDLELYTHWGFRMNITPLFYISSAAVGSVNPTRLVGMISIFIMLSASSLWIYFRFIAKKFLQLEPLPLILVPVMLLITGCLFLPIRSSITVAPLNTGVVYFHKTKSFPNHAGINVVWNFFDSLTAKDELKYPSNFYTGNAETVLNSMEKCEHPSRSLLRISKPNVIIIILESFTSKIIEPLGGMKDITPHLNKLVHEGVLFDHFYASGDRTDKGLMAILSSYPAQPETSIIRFPEKTQSLPFLSRELEKLDYHTSFVYGGDIGFANMESYLYTAGFSHITEDDDFDGSLGSSKWGIADEFVFTRLKEECDTARNPFFKVMLSLSSHEPFEVPMKPVLKGNDERSLFLNSCIYTDKSLGEFIEKAKQKPWWNNTLVVITADHGHRFPDAEELKDKGRFRIPMLWLGGALTTKDTVVHTLGGQTDITNTLLAELGTSSRQFKFSKNILDQQVKSFAVYVFNKGFGYIDSESEYVYDFDFQKFILQDGKEENQKYGKAYMQALFDDYNSR